MFVDQNYQREEDRAEVCKINRIFRRGRENLFFWKERVKGRVEKEERENHEARGQQMWTRQIKMWGLIQLCCRELKEMLICPDFVFAQGHVYMHILLYTHIYIHIYRHTHVLMHTYLSALIQMKERHKGKGKCSIWI